MAKFEEVTYISELDIQPMLILFKQFTNPISKTITTNNN
jgi:hypothetical protein